VVGPSIWNLMCVAGLVCWMAVGSCGSKEKSAWLANNIGSNTFKITSNIQSLLPHTYNFWASTPQV
jgi:hypothetical protein